MFNEFKQFAMRGNVVDLAIGVIIGGAFGAIVTSFVGDIMMPIIGVLTGGVDFSNMYVLLKAGADAGPYASLDAAKKAGSVVVAYGTLINTVVNFLIVAGALFVVVKGMNAAKKQEAAAPAAPPAPSDEVVLLKEIRDLLAKR
ncbi:MAG: large conductance mechanosensitive channel protein MscL [Vicinamibacterales bacterium]